MRTRSALVLAASALVAVSQVGYANTAPQITDAKGDGNGINGQGQVGGVSVAGGGSAALDVVSGKFESVKKGKTVTDLKVILELAGKPFAAEASSAIYRVTTNVGGCILWFQAQQTPDATAAFNVRTCSSTSLTGSVTTPITGGKIEETKLVWTIPLKTLAGLGFKSGALLEGLGAHTRSYAGTAATGGATVPQWDEAVSSLTYKLGS
jgi:hypothetical protein